MHRSACGGKDYQKNEQHLRVHLVPYFGRMRLDRISTFTIGKLKHHCKRTGLSVGTTNRILATYRRMGNRLHDWKDISARFPKVKLEKEHNQREIVISVDQER